MLEALRTGQAAQLAAMAQAWLAQGARAFSVWAGGALLRSWPAGEAMDAQAITAAVHVGRDEIGQLRVDGLSDPGARARLQADAMLLSQAIRLERDLQEMTAELIDNQDQLLAVYDLTRSTRTYLGTEGVLAQLTREAARLVKSAGAFVALAGGEGEPVVAHYPNPTLAKPAAVELLRHVQASERELLVNSEDAGVRLPNGVRNLLVIPVEVRRDYTAAMGWLNKQGGFTAPDLKLAQVIASHAGVQVENTLLQVEAVNQARMKTELDLAARIQLQLLPRRTPKWRHLQISARSRPALQVGGDFYEFIAEPGQHLSLAVGDVAGKGISAALLMSMTHTVIRSTTKFMPEATPERVVRRLNENLYDDFTDVSLFATVFIAQYDSTRNLLVYANAGHSPVIYRPAGGSARLLEADSPPIGVLPESVTREAQVPMGPGDLLVAATDGFNDAINLSGERFGYDQLLALVDRESHESTERLVSILFDAVDRHAAGCPQADDLTVVIVKGE